MNRVFTNPVPPKSRLELAVGLDYARYLCGGHAELVAYSNRRIAKANAIAEVSEAMSKRKVDKVKPLVLAGEYDADDAIDAAVGALLDEFSATDTLPLRIAHQMDAAHDADRWGEPETDVAPDHPSERVIMPPGVPTEAEIAADDERNGAERFDGLA